jgi:uncharacterized protein
MKKIKELKEPIKFEWDEGNSDKNWEKHNVSQAEAEQVFFDERKVMSDDLEHSGAEVRYVLLGRTEQQRLLYIAFTVRSGKVRVISARDINKKKEEPLYEEVA